MFSTQMLARSVRCTLYDWAVKSVATKRLGMPGTATGSGLHGGEFDIVDSWPMIGIESQMDTIGAVQSVWVLGEASVRRERENIGQQRYAMPGSE